MLWEVDKDELGDKRLNPEEAVIREREDLLKLAATRRIAHQDELEDQERSAGPRLHYSEILRRLRKISPQLKVVDGAPGNVAIYRPKRADEYDESGRDRNKDNFFHDYEYVTGMPQDSLPEYSHVILDTSLLPIREYRGWRTILIALIKAGAISYRGAVQEFGEASGERSSLWRSQLRGYRPH